MQKLNSVNPHAESDTVEEILGSLQVVIYANVWLACFAFTKVDFLYAARAPCK